MFTGIQTVFQQLKTRLAGQAGAARPSDGGAALYHYDIQSPGERSRVHLRIDADGSGLVLVNANRVMHVNPSAAFMARLALENTPAERAIEAICKAYQVSAEQAKSDYTHFTETLDELIRPDGACPIHDLDVEVTAPFSARPSAPYRMDLALTYRCNNDCPHCYNGRPRDFSEMTTEQWKGVLDQLWALGIPHVVFTGGEPTLRQDLPELIAHAEGNGQITGLNSNARRLNDRRYVDRLVEAGLDHVQITVESHDAQIHDRMVQARGAWKQTIAGLENVLATPLYVMTNTTMLQENSPYLADTLEFLSGLGVPTVGLNALIYSGHGRSVGTGLREDQLAPLLELARSHTSAHNQKLIWYTPTQYCNFDPMQLELGVKGCTAALYNMCVEPDGGVLPCQSYYYQMGNLLTDSWNSIWNHNLAITLRERRYVPEACNQCSLLAECGGGCPLTLENDLPRDNRPYLEQ
jgi:radical SAM protein with 4Fe4S-binding SPASM domain